MTALRIALVGAPNAGKSTLFNGLTGGHAKVANYPGVTVESRIGRFVTPGEREIQLIDLPGVYGLSARSLDEKVTHDALAGRIPGHSVPDAMIVLVDAANLRTHLHSVLQLRSIGLPMIVALNMIDLAERDGVNLDIEALERHLGVPVVPTCATRGKGRAALLARLDKDLADCADGPECGLQPPAESQKINPGDLAGLQRAAREIARDVILFEPPMNRFTRVVDSVVLNPVAGPLILAAILFFMFQAVFAWAVYPMDMIDAGAGALGDLVGALLPAEGWLHSLIVDGVIAGVGSVVIFLPQIVILFTFILVLEASGYMARAAFLMDELMLRVGLNGRAFIPLLSSFACAIPGMMAARTIENERDRLTTILVAPLMTCSARLPVYTLIIGAFIPRSSVGGIFNLQGLVMFGLYAVGVVSAVLVAFILKRTLTKGPSQFLLMELPTYKLPNFRDFIMGLWMRSSAFLKRAGTIIFGTSVVLWFLATFPTSASALRETFAGQIGSILEPILAPIGFNLQISIALVPGMAAREVAVGALGTVYAIENANETSQSLHTALQHGWSLPTALAFLAWYVFAPQCFATIATARRETNSRKWTTFMVVYLFALAYAGAGITFWLATWAGL